MSRKAYIKTGVLKHEEIIGLSPDGKLIFLYLIFEVCKFGWNSFELPVRLASLFTGLTLEDTKKGFGELDDSGIITINMSTPEPYVLTVRNVHRYVSYEKK